MEKIRISARWDLGVVAMDPNHTIKQLKEKIQRTEGFPIERLRIHSNGSEHPDEKTLRECEISDCTEMRVEFLRAVRPLKIVVACGGDWRSVEVDDLDRIWKLRYKLEEIGFPIPEVHFCIRNERIMRKDQTFRWHRVEEEDVIRVIPAFHPDFS